MAQRGRGSVPPAPRSDVTQLLVSPWHPSHLPSSSGTFPLCMVGRPPLLLTPTTLAVIVHRHYQALNIHGAKRVTPPIRVPALRSGRGRSRRGLHTFFWMDHNRRVGKDHERLVEVSEAYIYVVMSRMMLSGLACLWGCSDGLRRGLLRSSSDDLTLLHV